MTRLDHSYIAEALAQVAERRSDLQAKLEYALRMRSEMHSTLQAGQPYEGYRLKWVKESAALVLELLEMNGEDFQKAHPDDICTAYDLLDILKTAQNIIQARLKDQG